MSQPPTQCCTGEELGAASRSISMEFLQPLLAVHLQAMDTIIEENSTNVSARALGRVWLQLSVYIRDIDHSSFSLLHPEWGYTIGHKPYEKIGKDVFLVASPYCINAFVADAEAVTQITTRRNDFPKPLEIYGALNIYGKNLVSTEGAEWRMHRKLVAPSFGEKNNELVFTESLHHAQSLMGLWAGSDGRGNQTVADPSHGAMHFALYVISSAGFNVRVAWPHEEGNEAIERNSEGKSMFVGSKIPEGHTMNYREALSELLDNIIWTQIIPPKYLRESSTPSKLLATWVCNRTLNLA